MRKSRKSITTLRRMFFPDKTNSLCGWGLKPSARRASIKAKIFKKSMIRLEDGFLRSFNRNDDPVSLVCDTRGIYYDASRPSLIEDIIGTNLTGEQVLRANNLINLWVMHGVSKYNHQAPLKSTLPENYVLVIDQVKGDQSIKYGYANKETFVRMVRDALQDHPESQIVIKSHPDAISRPSATHFESCDLLANSRITIINEEAHLPDLIKHAAAVYTVTSQAGFEALLYRKPVYVYGVPFYALYGLTTDRSILPSGVREQILTRRAPATLQQLVHAAIVEYPRYRELDTGCHLTAEEAIILIGDQRAASLILAHREAHAVGFSTWKRPILRSFLKRTEVVFHDSFKQVRDRSPLLLWGSGTTEHTHYFQNIHRVEDGFIRSRGLGAGLHPPSSWVVDSTGIYYDSSRPSDIEEYLNTIEFNDSMRSLGAKIRSEIVVADITKYNVGKRRSLLLPSKRRAILVVGQVETDASIRFGSPVIKSNIELLTAVRKLHQDAFLIYKPHPDVVAGYRAVGAGEDQANTIADIVVEDIAITNLFSVVDEVHTITSLSGFEALIRGKEVTCYGQPFYSGWGLTTDVYPLERRGRALTIDELVYTALCRYPLYLRTSDNSLTSVFGTIAEIQSNKRKSFVPDLLRRHLLKGAARRAEKKREAQMR